MASEPPKPTQPDIAASMGRMDALQQIIRPGGTLDTTGQEFLLMAQGYVARANEVLSTPQVASALFYGSQRPFTRVIETSINAILYPPIPGHSYYDENEEIQILLVEPNERLRKDIGKGELGLYWFLPFGNGNGRAPRETKEEHFAKLGGLMLDQIRQDGFQPLDPQIRPSYIDSINIYRRGDIFGLLIPVRAEDFMKGYGPTIFEYFVRGVDSLIERATTQLDNPRLVMRQALQNNLDYVAQAVAEGRVNEQQIAQVARGTAEALIPISQPIQEAVQQGLTEDQVRGIVIAVIEERLAAMVDRRVQVAVTAEVQRAIQQLTPDPEVQLRLQEAVQSERDPNRVLQAVLHIAGGFIPGVQGVIAVIEAVNDLFGPLPGGR